MDSKVVDGKARPRGAFIAITECNHTLRRVAKVPGHAMYALTHFAFYFRAF